MATIEEMKDLVINYALDMLKKELIKLNPPNFEKMSKDEKELWIDRFLFTKYFYEHKLSFSKWNKEKSTNHLLLLQMLQYWLDFVDGSYNIKNVPTDVNHIYNAFAYSYYITEKESIMKKLNEHFEKDTNVLLQLYYKKWNSYLNKI